MKVHRSALKHGVLAEDAVQAADLSLWIEPLEEEEWPRRELRLGFDTQARLLETVVMIFRRAARRALRRVGRRGVAPIGPVRFNLLWLPGHRAADLSCDAREQ